MQQSREQPNCDALHTHPMWCRCYCVETCTVDVAVVEGNAPIPETASVSGAIHWNTCIRSPKKKKPIQRPRLQAQWMRRLHLNKCCVLIFATQSRWRCVYRKAGDSVFNWNVLLVWKALLTFCSMDCVYYSECFVFFIYGFLVYLFNLCFIIYILCRRIVSVCHRITHFP